MPVLPVCVYAILLAAPAAEKPAVQWQPSFEAAREKARAAGQPIMVDFWAEWCTYCHVLDRTTYVDPEVVRLSRSFISVKVNTEGSDAEQATAARHLVQSLPTISFLTPEGRQLWRLEGYAPPETFVKVIAEMQRVAKRILPLEAALAKDPQDAAALIGLGLHQYREMQQMARSDPSGAVPKSIFMDGKDLLTRAAAVDKGRPVGERKRVRKTLGLFAAAAADGKEAEAQLKAGLALEPADPEDAEIQAALGEIYMHLGKQELARAAFQGAVKGHPATPAAARARRFLEQLEAKK